MTTHSRRITVVLGSALLSLAGCTGELRGGDEGAQGRAAAAVSRELMGLNIAASGTPADAISQVGASWVRLEVQSDQTAAQLATILDGFHGRQIQVLLIVGYALVPGRPMFFDCGGLHVMGDWSGWRSAFLSRLRGLALELGDKVDAWEVWNEVDHSHACAERKDDDSCPDGTTDDPALGCTPNYNPGLPPGIYGPLLRDARQAIRAGSTAPVLVGGLDSGQTSYVSNAAVAAGKLYADAIGIHTYGPVPDQSWCAGDPGEDLVCDWGTIGQAVDRYYNAFKLPVWITEFGLQSSRNWDHQARYLTAAYQALEQKGAARVPHAFWFCYSDAMVPPMGLTDENSQPKQPMYGAYQAAAGVEEKAQPQPEPTPAPTPTPTPAPTPAPTPTQTPDKTSRMHGTVEIGGQGTEGIQVSCWGHDQGDFRATTTDALGIFVFEGLAANSQYNVVVNANFADGGFPVVDGAHASEVRNNVELVAGPDDWHGENFQLPY
jgi:hypothetical protein